MRRLVFALLVCLAGVGANEVVFRSMVCRDLIGRAFGHGHLKALIHGRGVYEIDERAAQHPTVDAAVRNLSGDEQVASSQVARECDLVRSQFGNERAFAERMRGSGFSRVSLWTSVSDNLKARQWIEKRLASQMVVSEEQCREFYRTHPDAFALPLRFRVGHLFLAAPPETPTEVVESKRLSIESLSSRIEQGENFRDLVAEASEDEATKWRGGDLGFFSSSRMLPEFFTAVTKLPVGGLSKPVRSHLGFHIIQLTAVEPPRVIPFEEAHAEITGILQNDQRRFFTDALALQLTGEAKYFDAPR